VTFPSARNLPLVIAAFCLLAVLRAAALTPGSGSPVASTQAPRAAAQKPRSSVRTGRATFMSDKLEGRRTASGTIYDGRQLVAAHPTYPLGTRVRVTSHENGRTVEVTIVDRSAAGARRPIIDLSRRAAERLDFVRRGTVQVTVEVIEWGPRPSKK
jgi:rare lipoprotein A